MVRMYFSYDKGRFITEDQYVRHLTKKWLKEAGISVERLREIAPQHDFKEKVGVGVGR